MPFNHTPPPIIYHVEESHTGRVAPYFFEYDGRILNLALATGFYVDHLPLTNYYWPCVRIAGNSYRLTPSMSSEEEAMNFLRVLAKKIQSLDTDDSKDQKTKRTE